MPGYVVHLPTVAGAVAIAYNLPGVDKGLKLSSDVVADMFLGNIRRWNDRRITALNPGVKLPDLPVAVVHRSDGSGTSYIFTSYLNAVSRAWSKRVGFGKSVDWPTGIGASGNAGVAGVVKQTPGSVAYVELAYAIQNHVPYAALKNRGKFVEPNEATTMAAAAASVKAMEKDVRVSIVNSPAKNAHPIAGFTYLLVYQKNHSAEAGPEHHQVPLLVDARRPGLRDQAPLRAAAGGDREDEREQDQEHQAVPRSCLRTTPRGACFVSAHVVRCSASSAALHRSVCDTDGELTIA